MIPIIISGGSGSRLWPVSRISDPKPFIKLADGKSLLQNTFLRVTQLQNVKNILTVTNEKLHFRMQDEYQQVNQENLKCDFILEPFGRNTAAAVASSCLLVNQNYSPDEIVLIVPADHLITDTDKFNNAVTKAIELANLGHIVTFGINPEYPETGYGYIEANHQQPIESGYKVKRFVEKPNLKTATKYIESKNYLWNSGMFCAKASVFINEFKKHAKNILSSTNNCLQKSQIDKLNDTQIIHLDSKSFLKVEDISIDYAILEKSDKVAVVPCSIGWSDIGSWLSIAQTIPKDKNNNAIIGESVLHNTNDCLFYSPDRIIAGVDLNNLIVVDTKDAILVANKDEAQNVKLIFERLKKVGHETSELHQTVHRPWGTYTVLEEGPFYKIKRIEVKSGASLSLQLHHHRSEHWIVVDGTATVTNGADVFDLSTNKSTYIPAENKHRLENKTEHNLAIIEVQCGSYLGEDDIVRFDDKYGRIPDSK